MVSKQIFAVGLIALVIGLSAGYSVPLLVVPQQLKPTITLSATTVKAGNQYTATVSGFSANTEIYGWTVNENPPRSFLAGTTDGNGNLVLPSYAPQTTGQWLLCASNKDQTSWANTLLTVEA